MPLSIFLAPVKGPEIIAGCCAYVKTTIALWIPPADEIWAVQHEKAINPMRMLSWQRVIYKGRQGLLLEELSHHASGQYNKVSQTAAANRIAEVVARSPFC